MIAAVRSVIAASTAAGSRQKSSGSMSANTGVAPVSATELAVAAKVNDGTMTSSPGPMPAASSPRCSPDVPEFTATQARPRPKCSANSCLERGDLGSLGEHAAAHDAVDGGPLLVADERLGGRDEAFTASLLLLVSAAGSAARCGLDVDLAGLRALQSPSPSASSGTPARPTQPIRRAGTPATSAKSARP